MPKHVMGRVSPSATGGHDGVEVVRRGKGLCLVGIIVNWLNLLLLLFSPERSYRVFDAFHMRARWRAICFVFVPTTYMQTRVLLR